MFAKAKTLALALVAALFVTAGSASASCCRYEWRTCYVTVCYTAYDCHGCPYKAYKTVEVRKLVKVCD